jgi:hypothetical protein
MLEFTETEKIRKTISGASIKFPRVVLGFAQDYPKEFHRARKSHSHTKKKKPRRTCDLTGSSGFVVCTVGIF